MAEANSNPVTIRMAGLDFHTTGKPTEILAFADVLLGAVARALYQETVSGCTFEDSDRYALGELIQGARDCMKAVQT